MPPYRVRSHYNRGGARIVPRAFTTAAVAATMAAAPSLWPRRRHYDGGASHYDVGASHYDVGAVTMTAAQ
jgi:hypothetical protein